MNKKDCVGFYFPFHICMAHDITHTSVGSSRSKCEILPLLGSSLSSLSSEHDSDIVEFRHKIELPTVLWCCAAYACAWRMTAHSNGNSTHNSTYSLRYAILHRKRVISLEALQQSAVLPIASMYPTIEWPLRQCVARSHSVHGSEEIKQLCNLKSSKMARH